MLGILEQRPRVSVSTFSQHSSPFHRLATPVPDLHHRSQDAFGKRTSLQYPQHAARISSVLSPRSTRSACQVSTARCASSSGLARATLAQLPLPSRWLPGVARQLGSRAVVPTNQPLPEAMQPSPHNRKRSAPHSSIIRGPAMDVQSRSRYAIHAIHAEHHHIPHSRRRRRTEL